MRGALEPRARGPCWHALTAPDSVSLMGAYTGERVQLGLALLAYAGSHGEPARSASALHEHLVDWLARLDVTRDREIVWGPVCYRLLWQSSAPALIAFVTRARADVDGALQIVVRGGAPIGVWDPCFEELACVDQEPWVWARGAGNLAPAVCAGVLAQLEVLRELTPDEPLPGAGRTLLEFLAQRASASEAQGEPASAHVLGHGLGGALACALALWLRDTQGSERTRELCWDPGRALRLCCTSFASPAFGNSDFATYITERLGGALELIHNPLDHAVSLWDAQAMVELEQLYKPHVERAPLLFAVVHALCEELERRGVEYEQLPAQLLERRLNSALPPSYVAQAEYQHLHAYAEQLGLELDFDALLGRPCGTDGGPIAQ